MKFKEPKKYNINITDAIVYPLAADKFDLTGWMRNFSKEQYMSCTPASKAHKGSNTFLDENGDITYREDEFVGGFMMTQYYKEQLMTPNKIRLVSNTRGRFAHVWPMRFPLFWEMEVTPYDENNAVFTTRIGVRLNWIYWLLSKVICLQFWAESHAEEETPYFAYYAAKWATENNNLKQ